MKPQSLLLSRPAIIAFAVVAILALVLVMVLRPKAAQPRRVDSGTVVTLPYVPPPEPRPEPPVTTPSPPMPPESAPVIEEQPEPEPEPEPQRHYAPTGPPAPIPYEELGPPGTLEAPWAPIPPQAPTPPEAPRA